MTFTLQVEHMVKSSPQSGTIDFMTIAARTGALAHTLTVGDVAIESGVAASAVRFYEKHHIVTALRNSGNQRRFDESAGCRIRVAKLAQRVGLTVREIALLFEDLPSNPSPQDWGRVTEALIQEAETRTAELRARIDDMWSGAKLCDIVESIGDVE